MYLQATAMTTFYFFFLSIFNWNAHCLMTHLREKTRCMGTMHIEIRINKTWQSPAFCIIATNVLLAGGDWRCKESGVTQVDKQFYTSIATFFSCFRHSKYSFHCSLRFALLSRFVISFDSKICWFCTKAILKLEIEMQLNRSLFENS